ncbi:MAG: hypothetical protein SOZ96_10795 [Treponema sp.]|nr:hypothetical protein [Treponema sp.]MDY5818585.1 hypothetical protein [Treponema sp.]
MNKEINKEYYYMDRERINRICTILKYLSLIPSFDRIDVFKNTISTDVAFKLLNIILSDTEWINENDNDYLGRLKCRIPEDYQNLLDYILNNYGEFEKEFKDKTNRKYSLTAFQSNYESGYYGEIYDRANLRKSLNTENENKPELEEYSHIKFLLGELKTLCIEIERYKAYFCRNLFGGGRNKNLNLFTRIFLPGSLKFDRDEEKYLWLLFDSLHNIPEYIQKIELILEGKTADKPYFELFITEINFLYKLIINENGAFKRIYGYKIFLTNKIKRWMHELQAAEPSAKKVFEILFQLSETGYFTVSDSTRYLLMSNIEG